MMPPAPARTASIPSPRIRPCWNPAVPPPPVGGATVGTGLGDGLGVTVGDGVGVGDGLGDGEVDSLGEAEGEGLSEGDGEARSVGGGAGGVGFPGGGGCIHAAKPGAGGLVKGTARRCLMGRVLPKWFRWVRIEAVLPIPWPT